MSGLGSSVVTWLCAASREPVYSGQCNTRNLWAVRVCPVCGAARPRQSSFRAAIDEQRHRQPSDLEEALRRQHARGVSTTDIHIHDDEVLLVADGRTWRVIENELRATG